ncbi:hypothetical protein ACOSP7_011405 [Xanthoceras sorbifolium]
MQVLHQIPIRRMILYYVPFDMLVRFFNQTAEVISGVEDLWKVASFKPSMLAISSTEFMQTFSVWHVIYFYFIMEIIGLEMMFLYSPYKEERCYSMLEKSIIES